jgi:hypothetical protein
MAPPAVSQNNAGLHAHPAIRRAGRVAQNRSSYHPTDADGLAVQCGAMPDDESHTDRFLRRRMKRKVWPEILVLKLWVQGPAPGRHPLGRFNRRSHLRVERWRYGDQENQKNAAARLDRHKCEVPGLRPTTVGRNATQALEL